MKAKERFTFRIVGLTLIVFSIQTLAFLNEARAQNMAINPDPADGTVLCATWATITWSSVDPAALYKVYFGEDAVAVANGTELDSTFMGNQTSTSFTVGIPGHPYPNGLVPGTTYYWRIDVMQADGMIYKGEIWSFTVLSAQILFVDQDATGANDGSSWTDAFNYLKDALAAATACDEIWVAEGTYKPDQDTVNPNGTLDPDATFALKNNVQLYGGFIGTETTRDQRDWQIHETFLSGYLQPHPDLALSYHVVTSTQVSQMTVLDGFTIAYGYARHPGIDRSGGGMRNEGGRPTVRNCHFGGNTAEGNGGGMYNHQSNPIISGCSFSQNRASNGCGGGMFNNESNPEVTDCSFTQNIAYEGGAMGNDSGSNPVVTLCVFMKNSASGGGGMYNYRSNPTIRDCDFSLNSAEGLLGGGILNHESSPQIIDCLFYVNDAGVGAGVDNYSQCSPTIIRCKFVGNRAEVYGGGMRDRGCNSTVINCVFGGNFAQEWGGGLSLVNSDTAFVNCTISGNRADVGSGILNRGGALELKNCIIWGHAAPTGPHISLEYGSTLHASFTDLEGGLQAIDAEPGSIAVLGNGMIDTNPQYADPIHWNIDGIWIKGDCHLKSQNGRWDSLNNVWVLDPMSSPCIDAGDPGMSVGDEPAPNGGRINMGAYGGTIEASKSEAVSGLLAYWKLDELEGNIAHDSADGYDGTYHGNPSRPDFDGIDDYVSTPYVLNPAQTEFTVSAWVRDGAPGQVIVSQTGGAVWLGVDASTGTLMTGVAGLGPFGPSGPLVSGTVITDGERYHVALIWNGADRILYANGVEVARDSQESIAGSVGGINIGAGRNLGPFSFWSGLISDVRVSNVAQP